MTSWLIVSVQLATFIYILLSGPIFALNNWIFFVEIVGAAFGLWGLYEMSIKGVYNVTPELPKSAKLVTSGPYQYVRNPMYTGMIVAAGALVADYYTVTRLIAFILMVAVLLIKINIEEKHLKKRFKEYKKYASKTKRLIPFVY